MDDSQVIPISGNRNNSVEFIDFICFCCNRPVGAIIPKLLDIVGIACPSCSAMFLLRRENEGRGYIGGIVTGKQIGRAHV